MPARTFRTALCALPLLIGQPPAPDRCTLSNLRSNPEGYQYRLAEIQRFVAEADVIARVTAIDSLPLPVIDDRPWAWKGSAIGFTVDELLRGPDSLQRITLEGRFVDRDDFNPRPVPYRLVRRAGQRGDCYAREYRKGASYLLLLKADATGLGTGWGPLAPVNEQLRGPDDPWLQWVREEMARSRETP